MSSDDKSYWKAAQRHKETVKHQTEDAEESCAPRQTTLVETEAQGEEENN